MQSGSGRVTASFPLLRAVLVLMLSCSVQLLAQHAPKTNTIEQSTGAQKATVSPQLLAQKMSVAFVQVPDVRGYDQATAQSRLREAGLRDGTVTSAPGPGTLGTVWQQEPAPNTTVRRGSIFNLVLVATPPQHTSDGSKMQRQVPSLIGLTPYQAKEKLYGTRLLLGTVSAGNGNGTAGTIYNQNPQAESWVPLGTRIDVEFVQPQPSPPPPIWVFVPNLVGQDEKTAKEMIPHHGLVVGDVTRSPASAPPETVFAQYPLPKSRVLQGTAVNVQIALPPPEVTIPVPNLIQQNLNVAETTLMQSGLQLGAVRTEETANAAPDAVLDQSPEPGTHVTRGTPVNVVIAQAIPPVAVPNVINRDQVAAREILESAGLLVGDLSEKPGNAPTGTVLAQSPPAGSMVSSGTTVDLTLSRVIIPALSLSLSNPTPKKGELVKFHADLTPDLAGVRYRFSFGDADSDWLDRPDSSHVYEASGDYRVRVVAQARNITVNSDYVPLHVPFNWIPIAVIGGICVVGSGTYVYRGWKLFQSSVRVVPRSVPGTQVVSVHRDSTPNQSIRLRIVHDPGEARIVTARAQTKGSGHD